MGYNFLPYDLDQEHLMPKSLHDWVEDDSLERFVSDLIDQFDAEGRLDPFSTPAPARTAGAIPPTIHGSC